MNLDFQVRVYYTLVHSPRAEAFLNMSISQMTLTGINCTRVSRLPRQTIDSDTTCWKIGGGITGEIKHQ